MMESHGEEPCWPGRGSFWSFLSWDSSMVRFEGAFHFRRLEGEWQGGTPRWWSLARAVGMGAPCRSWNLHLLVDWMYLENEEVEGERKKSCPMHLPPW